MIDKNIYTVPAKIRFESEMPKVKTKDQAAAVLRCRFAKELDEWLERNKNLFTETESEK